MVWCILKYEGILHFDINKQHNGPYFLYALMPEHNNIKTFQICFK